MNETTEENGSRMKTLDEIAVHYGTDKGSRHPLIAGHNYAVHYEEHFARLRGSPVRLLEIGVGGGESIRTWLAYFFNAEARIFGVDIVQGTNPFNTVHSEVPRYRFTPGDQGKEAFWLEWLAERSKDKEATQGSAMLDIVIDDGSHYAGDIFATHKALWPEVKPGGFYCIEDLAVAYGGPPFTKPGVWQNHMDFVKDKLDDINRHGEIRGLHFTKELAIIQKS